MSPLAETLLLAFATLMFIMIVLWLTGTARRDASIVDPFWGVGFVIVAWLASWLNQPVHPRDWLLCGLTTVWGLRLSAYLSWRNWGQEEDRRYGEMRDRHGPRFWWVSLFTVFLLQGVLLWFISLPLQVAVAGSLSMSLGWLDALGTCVWAIGMFFETAGDWQLARFQADPGNAGLTMDRGLWRYTRHPNYFGDFCVWWGLYLIAVGGGAWWTVGSSILMSLLLWKVSGVALLERTIAHRRPGYLAYSARTNALFPGRPRA